MSRPPRKEDQPRDWTPDRPGRRGAAPTLVGEVLVGTQEYIAKKTGTLMSHEEWRRVVGAKIASRSRLGGLARGTLTIKVASSAWSNELSFLKADIVERLSLAGYEVTGLRFLVDPSPFQGRTLGPEARAPQQRAPEPARELPSALEERLRHIDDPNLRAAIREAASWSLGTGSRSSAPAVGQGSRAGTTSRAPADRGSGAAGPRPRPRR